jgi:hypothetical protein
MTKAIRPNIYCGRSPGVRIAIISLDPALHLARMTTMRPLVFDLQESKPLSSLEHAGDGQSIRIANSQPPTPQAAKSS